MRNLGPKNLTDQIVATRVPLEIRLETNRKTFNQVEAQFLTDLAAALGTTPEEIRKIKILAGCVRFIFDLPADVAEKFKKALKEKPLPVELQKLFETYNIDFRNTKFNVVEEAPYVKRLLELSNELQKDGRILTWLHLSDVHFQNKSGAMKWNQDKVKESFITALPALLASWDLSPDLLFFTGDLAYSGETEQYTLASDFLTRVKDSLKEPLRTYVVPGNHDVCWDLVGDRDKQVRRALTNRYDVAKLLLNESNQNKKNKIFDRFRNFWQFLNTSLNQNGSLTHKTDYYYVDLFDHLGLKLGIAGLNSAWLSTRKKSPARDDDIGELVLGEPQIMESVKALAPAQIKFALLHHPPESMWFKSFDRPVQKAQLPSFDFILRGHEHEPVTQSTTNIMTDEEYIHFASGALYDASELQGKSGYPISFNAVRLNLDTGKGAIFYWRYFSDLYKWRPDAVVDNGFKEFDIPERVLDRIRHAPESEPVILPKSAGIPIPSPDDKNPNKPSQ